MRKTRKRTISTTTELINDVVVEYRGVKSTFLSADMERLGPRFHFNENVVDFFLSKRALECTDDLTLEVCSTSFYRLLSEPKHLAHASNVPVHVNEALERVNYLDTQHLHPRFFSCSFAFIPVNIANKHWVLAVAYHRDCPAVRRLGSIIVFDSRPSADSPSQHAQIAGRIRDFMNCEWCFKHEFGQMDPSKVFTAQSCPLIVPNIVRQPNDCDCGLYVIKSAEVVMNNASEISAGCMLTDKCVTWLENFFLDKVVVDPKKGRAYLRKEVKDMSILTS